MTQAILFSEEDDNLRIFSHKGEEIKADAEQHEKQGKEANESNDVISKDEASERIAEESQNIVPGLSQFVPDEAVYHGLAGIIKLISPETEADPMALLMSFLVSFGNIVGRASYYEIEATRHYPNLFTVLVGDSSKARKGSSWSIVRKIFKGISWTGLIEKNHVWADNNIKSGLASGEGLKYHVRDAPIKKDENSFEKTIDKGIEDKRLLIVEPEFASVLKVANRTGSTLSTTIRDSWDTGILTTLTKNDPINATNAHISILSHITIQELNQNLTDTEAANGLANRFLWVFVKRSKLLPFGGNIPFTSLPYDKLKTAIKFAQSTQQLTMDDEARKLWANIYEELSKSELGLLGTITSRSEAQVVRLALIYALLDCSPVITTEHLQAALAVWKYCEASARYIFSEKFGNPLDKLPRDRRLLYDALPESFTTDEGLKVALKHNFPARTFKRFLKEKELFTCIRHGNYEKCM